MSGGFIVHGVPGSPYVRIVLLALEEKRAPWRLAAVAMGGNRAPDYAAIHPFRKMPAIEHGDFHLYETDAILRYIDAVVPNPPLIPDGIRARARMAQLISITNSYLAPRVSGAVTFQRCVAPLLGLPIDEATLAAAMPDAHHCLGTIEALMGDAPFMVGDALSLADCMIAPHLSFLDSFAEGRDLLGERPRLAAWIERMHARPSMAATSWDRLIALTGAKAA